MLKFNYSTSLSTSILNILCFILVLINLSAQSQEKTNYPFEIVEDAEVIVITNRILDYSDGKYNISSNIDTAGPLTYYYSKHIGDYQISLQNLDQGQLHTVIKEKGGNWLLFVHGDYKTLELAVYGPWISAKPTI